MVDIQESGMRMEGRTRFSVTLINVGQTGPKGRDRLKVQIRHALKSLYSHVEVEFEDFEVWQVEPSPKKRNMYRKAA